jgi:rhodanese-related sulfurtransferase
MKLIALLCLVGLATGLVSAQEPAKKLTADELKTALAKTERVVFLDVREPKELEELGTIKGSQNIPVGEVENRLKDVPKDRPIIVGCNRAVRAAKAAAILQKNGYNVVGVTALNEWKEKNYELVYPAKSGK